MSRYRIIYSNGSTTALAGVSTFDWPTLLRVVKRNLRDYNRGYSGFRPVAVRREP